jgi:hypothetical protein
VDEPRFWAIIAKACRSNPRKAEEEWAERLQKALEKLPADEIVEWNHIFDRLATQAYTIDLWGAAYLINGGASDDGFYYFRCWLIGMGQEVYEAAIANPDSLADVNLPPEVDAEAEIYAAAHLAWIAVTGKTYDDPYPARNESARLRGRRWDFDDDEQVRRRFPRLAAKYLTDSYEGCPGFRR